MRTTIPIHSLMNKTPMESSLPVPSRHSAPTPQNGHFAYNLPTEKPLRSSATLTSPNRGALHNGNRLDARPTAPTQQAPHFPTFAPEDWLTPGYDRGWVGSIQVPRKRKNTAEASQELPNKRKRTEEKMFDSFAKAEQQVQESSGRVTELEKQSREVPKVEEQARALSKVGEQAREVSERVTDLEKGHRQLLDVISQLLAILSSLKVPV